MKHIYVKSLPLKDVIRDLAQETKSKVTENCGEYILKLNPKSGKGDIKAMNFDQALGMIEYNCTFHENTKIHFSLSQVHPLKFLFCSQGTLKHYFEETEKPNILETYQNVLVASSAFNGHVLDFTGKKKTHLNSLEINREKFIEKYRCSLEGFENNLTPVLMDVNAKKKFFYKGNYSLSTAAIIKEINQTPSAGFLRFLKLESRALDTLAAQIEQYEDDLKTGENQTLIRKQEIEQITLTVKKMTQDLSVSYTAKQLAKETGLNLNKLQKAFKHLYQQTINEFIQQKRIEKAEELLKETDLSIQEITEKIGLSNSSYFSKIFKKYYHTTPNKFRNFKKSKP